MLHIAWRAGGGGGGGMLATPLSYEYLKYSIIYVCAFCRLQLKSLCLVFVSTCAIY